MEPFQVSQQETGEGAAATTSTNSSSGDLLRARAAAVSTTASLSAADEFHRPSHHRDRSRSRGRLRTTTNSRHRSLSQQRASSNRRRHRSQRGPAETVLEGFADAWETIMSGGIEMFRSEAMSLMQVRLSPTSFSISESCLGRGTVTQSPERLKERKGAF